MRFVKYVLAALVALFLFYQFMINLGALSQAVSLKLAVPFYVFTRVELSLLAALVICFAAAFLLAVALEVLAWYEYNRTIVLQRKQILALQKALEEKGAGRGED